MRTRIRMSRLESWRGRMAPKGAGQPCLPHMGEAFLHRSSYPVLAGCRMRCTSVASKMMVMERIRVLLVGGEASIRRGLRMLLESEAELEVVGEAEDGPRAC